MPDHSTYKRLKGRSIQEIEDQVRLSWTQLSSSTYKRLKGRSIQEIEDQVRLSWTQPSATEKASPVYTLKES